MPDTVHVGDRDITIADFSAYKFLEATDLLARILEIVPELDADVEAFVKSHAARTAIRIDRATAEMRYGGVAKQISEETWEKTGQRMTIEDEPSGFQIAMRVWPKIQRHARKDAEWLLALIATANSELEEADEAGVDLYGHDGPVTRSRRFIVHNGTPSQAAMLIVAAAEVLWAEIEAGSVMDELGKLMDRIRPTETPDPAPNRKARRQAKKVVGGGAPRSSTRSQAPTKGGRAETSSIASPTGN